MKLGFALIQRFSVFSHDTVTGPRVGNGACANTSHDFATQSSHSVDRVGWLAKMASIAMT